MFILFCASANQSMSLLGNQAVDSNIHPLQSLEKALWSVIGKGLVACHSICEFFFFAVRSRPLIMPLSILVSRGSLI